MSDDSELRWHPPTDDPAWNAGQDFLGRQQATADGAHGFAPCWHGWMVRQAFWCGIRWARERNSLPVLGQIGDDGGIEWNGGDGP